MSADSPTPSPSKIPPISHIQFPSLTSSFGTKPALNPPLVQNAGFEGGTKNVVVMIQIEGGDPWEILVFYISIPSIFRPVRDDQLQAQRQEPHAREKETSHSLCVCAAADTRYVLLWALHVRRCHCMSLMQTCAYYVTPCWRCVGQLTESFWIWIVLLACREATARTATEIARVTCAKRTAGVLVFFSAGGVRY